MSPRLPATLALAALLPLGAAAATRDQVIDLARDYAYHEWDCTAANLTVDCSNSWSSDYSVGTYLGVPYDWGGFVTLQEFDDDIADGLGAGSHSWHDVLSCTTGVDCSGFVSEVWFEPTKYGTWTIDQVSFEIDREDLLRGDAINQPGYHIVLYAHESDAGKLILYESAGYDVRLTANVSWYSLNGYTPIRHDSITNGNAHGTPNHPFEIGGFPYETFDATPGAGSDSLDGYACDPSLDESGPERVYRFELAEQGTLTATVTDDASTDVDLFLLSSTDPDDCVDHADNSFSEHLQPGTWYLVADTWVDGNGAEGAGGYYLVAEFSPGADPGDDDDDNDTGDDDDTADDDDTGDDDAGDDDAGDDDTGSDGDDDTQPPPHYGPNGEDEGDGCRCVAWIAGRATPTAPSLPGLLALAALVALLGASRRTR